MGDEAKTHLLQVVKNVDGINHKINDRKLQDDDSEQGGFDSSSSTSSSSITPMLFFSTLIVAFGSLSCGYSTGFTSPVQAQIIDELELSTAQFSLFGSLGFIGGAVGSIMCGLMTDYIGRRRALGVAALFAIFGWLAISFAQGAWLLYVGRWMVGFATATTNFAAPVYIAEFSPKNLRGGLVIVNVLMLATGVSTVFIVGVYIPWRSLALIGSTFSIFELVGLFFIPESPRWLVMKRENHEFEAALQRFRGKSLDISEEAFDMKNCVESLQQKTEVNILHLLQRKYAYILTVGFGLATLSALNGVGGLLSYSFSIFESAGLSGVVGNVAIAVFQLPGVFLGLTLTDKFGRRPLLMISAGGLSLGCLLAGLSFVLKDYQQFKDFSPYLALVGILIYFVSYPANTGASGVIVSEIYPLNIKGLAGSVGSITTSLLGWVVTYGFNFSMEWSSSGTFFILAGICAFGLIFVAKLVPETKGKTLEEVYMSMSII